uniref:B box-type domain-containing protein n=1 Tax=Romanomermis culicivorax TaxID=13658 RepID=A0A915HSB0_ROMCU
MEKKDECEILCRRYVIQCYSAQNCIACVDCDYQNRKKYASGQLCLRLFQYFISNKMRARPKTSGLRLRIQQ